MVFPYPVQRALLRASRRTILLDNTLIVRIVKATLLIKISSLLPPKALPSLSRNKSTETAAVSLLAGPSLSVGFRGGGGVRVIALPLRRVFPA